jgi:hypothetical protein
VRPQSPQFMTSEDVSMQRAGTPQGMVSLAAQTQVPTAGVPVGLQVKPPAASQASPHSPQFSLSEVRSTHRVLIPLQQTFGETQLQCG